MSASCQPKIGEETEMESWLKLTGTTTRSSGVGSARARLGSLTGAFLPRLGFVIAVICSVTLFAFSARA
jgi:hypothetical protein